MPRKDRSERSILLCGLLFRSADVKSLSFRRPAVGERLKYCRHYLWLPLWVSSGTRLSRGRWDTLEPCCDYQLVFQRSCPQHLSENKPSSVAERQRFTGLIISEQSHLLSCWNGLFPTLQKPGRHFRALQDGVWTPETSRIIHLEPPRLHRCRQKRPLLERSLHLFARRPAVISVIHALCLSVCLSVCVFSCPGGELGSVDGERQSEEAVRALSGWGERGPPEAEGRAFGSCFL